MKTTARILAVPSLAGSALVASLLLLGSGSSVLGAHDRVTTNVTWSRDIQPIVHERCARCHNPDGPGPMDLTTYQEARPWAKAIKEEVLARRMPKWHAARGYGEFANDPSLSAFEIALIVAWADGGAPKGTGEASDVRAQLPADGAAPQTPVRKLTLSCRPQPLPAGQLLAVRPMLDRGGSAGIAVVLPGGRREIVAWIRNFDPEFIETYWLRRPLELRRGSRLAVDASGPCELTVSLARGRRMAP